VGQGAARDGALDRAAGRVAQGARRHGGGVDPPEKLALDMSDETAGFLAAAVQRVVNGS